MPADQIVEARPELATDEPDHETEPETSDRPEEPETPNP
jgi:hypothetical protein